jgi:hypothetical protein
MADADAPGCQPQAAPPASQARGAVHAAASEDELLQLTLAPLSLGGNSGARAGGTCLGLLVGGSRGWSVSSATPAQLPSAAARH